MRMVRAAMFGLALTGCSAQHVDGVEIGMVTDAGGLGDHSFDDSANAGLQLAARTFGVHAVVLQSRSPVDYQPNLMAFSEEGYSEIFSIGYDEAFDLREVAKRFPNRHYAIIDSVVNEPNITSITFKSEQGSFLAGALAAMMTKTKTIGFLGGMDIPIIRVFEAGYAAGAREIDPSVRVEEKYAGDFTNVAAGNELAAMLFNGGATIVYTAAGKVGLGSIEQVRERSGDFLIGVDSDQDGIAPGKILTSVLKRIDRSVYVVSALAAKHQPRPRRLSLGLAEGAVGLTDFRYTRRLIPSAALARLARLKAAVISGKIVVPRTPQELARFKPGPY